MAKAKLQNGNGQVVLATVTGQDAPGITSEMTRVLAQSNATVLDIGQAVIHGLLSLSILFEIHKKDSDKATIKELLFKATEMGLKLEFQVLTNKKSHENGALDENQPFRYAITLMAEPVTASVLHKVTACLATFYLNIDFIQRMSEGHFHCVELQVSSTKQLDQKTMKKTLLKIAGEERVDIALQAEGLFRRAKRLVVMDMDSTLIQNEVIDLFAKKNGVYKEVAAITEAAMQGKMDFDESLIKRCEKLKGLSIDKIDEVFQEIEITPGATELIRVLKRLGYKVALISGGFTCIADRLKEKLGIHYAYANTLDIEDGKFTGRVIPPIVNAQRKADLLSVIAQQEDIFLDQVIAIGDGANDLLMLQKAGLGIAFNAKTVVSEQADLSLSSKSLKSIFYLLGFSGREIQQAL